MVVFLSKPIYNKWYAQVRLNDSKRGNSLMKDLFFDLDTWPKHLIEIFVTPVTRIGYHDRYMCFKIYALHKKTNVRLILSCRLKIATFFTGNGLSVHNAENLFISYSRESTFDRDFNKKLNKILQVMKYVRKEENIDRYYYYNIYYNIFYFNGERKCSN